MASTLVLILLLYVILGVLVGLCFVLIGVQRIDPVAADSSRVFRLVIFPGSAALWPVVLWMWIRGRKAGRA